MDKNLRHIEQLFKSVLGDDEEMPEPKVWKAIEAALQKDEIPGSNTKYQNIKKLAFFLVFLFVAANIHDSNRQQSGENNQYAAREIKKASVIAGGDLKNNKVRTISKLAPNKIELTRSETHEENKMGKRDLVRENFKSDYKKQLPLASFKKTNIKSKSVFDRSTINEGANARVFKPVKKEDKNEIADRQNAIALALLPEGSGILSAKVIRQADLDTVSAIALHSSSNRISVASDTNSTTQTAPFKSIKTKNNTRSPFSLNIFFSPDFASYRLKDNIPWDNLNEATETEENEQHEFSSTVGALVEYQFKKHWSIQSGLTYSNTNITVNPQFIYAERDIAGSVKYILNTSSGYGYVLPSFSRSPTVGDSIFALTTTHTLQYVSVPINIKYNVQVKKLTFNVLAGTDIHYLIKGKVETLLKNRTHNEPEEVDKLQGLKRVYFSGSVGLGAEYLLFKKVAITFAPTYRFALNAINKEGTVKSYPNSIGFATGIKFGF